MTGRDLLIDFLDRHDITREQCATALKVSRTALYYWLTGQTSPGGASRQDIETWTSGAVPAESWGSYADHRKKDGATPAVEPFSPPVPHDR